MAEELSEVVAELERVAATDEERPGDDGTHDRPIAQTRKPHLREPPNAEASGLVRCPAAVSGTTMFLPILTRGAASALGWHCCRPRIGCGEPGEPTPGGPR